MSKGKEQQDFQIPENTEQTMNPMVCELSIMMYEKLRYTRFISSIELEKLHSCKNLDQLSKYIELENEILQLILAKYPDSISKKNGSRIHLQLNKENEEILGLIQEYVSIDYIRYINKNLKDDTISWVDILLKRNKRKKLYISDIEITHR